MMVAELPTPALEELEVGGGRGVAPAALPLDCKWAWNKQVNGTGILAAQVNPWLIAQCPPCHARMGHTSKLHGP